MHEREIRDVLTATPVVQLLQSEPTLSLAYSATDGAPRVVPIGFVVHDTRFVVCTYWTSPKVAALDRDDRVALTIDAYAPAPRCLLVRGVAEIEVVDGVPPEFFDATRRVTGDEPSAEFEASTRRLYDRMARITITPTWAKFLDFQTQAPSAVERRAKELT